MNEYCREETTACTTYIKVPHMITIKEAMLIFKIGRTTIDDGIQSMELPAYRPNGKKYLLDAEEVSDWIKSKKYQSGYNSAQYIRK